MKDPCIVHCGECGHEWAIGFLPMTVDTFVKVAKSDCPACTSSKVLMGPQPKPTPAGDALSWIHNGDTGTSSETIWSVMTGRDVTRYGVPLDPSDFGRCYRLLKIMPSWRARLPEVVARFPRWAKLIEAWDELTALYEEELPSGMAPRLYARMRELEL